MMTILAVSASADFEPERREDAQPGDEKKIHWTFELPRSQAVGPGVYELRFVRTLAEERNLGNPVLGGRA